MDLLKPREAIEEPVVDEYSDPEHILCWVDGPRTVKRGEELSLEITIENGRPDQPFRLSRIDVAETFLEGFTLVDIEPRPRNEDRMQGYLFLEYPENFGVGESNTFAIKLRASKTGVFIGDVDVLEGQRWLTRTAQIRITE